MAFPNGIYAPPGVFTETTFQTALQGVVSGLKLPVFLGTGQENLTQTGLEVIRGSSSTVDQRIVQEDLDGRAVSNVADDGSVTLTAFDGEIRKVQVRNYPIVTGRGTGTTTTSTSDVTVTINGTAVPVLSVTGSTGVLELATAPVVGDVVRATYYFKRTDTEFTDDVSAQLSAATVYSTGVRGLKSDSASFVVVAGANDVLEVTVETPTGNVDLTITLSVGTYTAAQLVSQINAQVGTTTLVASRYAMNVGGYGIALTADYDLTVGSGSANGLLGFNAGSSVGLNHDFYVYQGPIVDGSNGGVTTTDPSDVVVKVNNVQVIPTAVDGATRKVTLPYAPASDATVTVTYYANTWQDTFDYLAHINVQEVTKAGLTPDRSDYVEGTDFVLQNDLILWGSASAVRSGLHTSGATYLDDSQVSTTLVDSKAYLEVCTAVVDQTVSPSVEDRKRFTLPLSPTTGNGRDTPLGSTVFGKVANNRLDLPTNRPDLVSAYWGYSAQDALNRGPVTVSKVEGSEITLASAVPVGATVYASFYYNVLQDLDTTLEVVVAGPAGTGSYRVVDADGVVKPTPLFGTKSGALSSITVEFPTGSERNPDVRFESPLSDATNYTGAVEEDVTVTFITQDSTLGAHTVPNAEPYAFISGESDKIRLLVDGSALAAGATGLDLDAVWGTATLGFPAAFVGEPVVYEVDNAGATQYTTDSTNNTVSLTVDGVQIDATAESSGTATLATYVNALNRAVTGDQGQAQAGSGASTLVMAASSSAIDDYYVGWTVHVTAGPASGDVRTVTAYNGATTTATVDSAWSGLPVATNTYTIYNVDALPRLKTKAVFTAPVTITAGEYDDLTFHYTGATAGASGNIQATIAPATYASATTLATAVQSAIDTAITGAGLGAAFDAFDVRVQADSDGHLEFILNKAEGDASGYLEFITDGTPGEDFAILAGIDTAGATNGAQSKVYDGPIARRFTIAGDSTSALTNDRLVLRGRVVPGDLCAAAQTGIVVLSGSGLTNVGLSSGESGSGALKATVQEAWLEGDVTFAGGQVASGTYTGSRDGQALVTFYPANGDQDQNNIFNVTIDGTPVEVVFTDAAGAAVATTGSEVPLGPIGTANTVLNQIRTALVAAGLPSTSVDGLGTFIRLYSSSQDVDSEVTIGTGNANALLGFTDGASASRTLVTADVLASALMADSGTSVSTHTLNWTSPTATHFAAEALAKVVADDLNAKYLYVQSQGTSGLGTASSVTWRDPTTDSVLKAGTNLGAVDGDGGVGEAGVSGFYVTSSDTTHGSGTVNTSVLNPANTGVGQDGLVGQTYRDAVTGLTFTILERSGGSNYPSTASFTFKVRNTVKTDSNLPIRTIPGVETVVTNTYGVAVGDTAVVSTYKRSGSEPGIGDVYYVTYTYQKESFDTQYFTKLSAVQNAYGSLGLQNPLTLASYLAILNGAVILGAKQVQKDAGSATASTASYVDAVVALEGAQPGAVYPDILVPLDAKDTALYSYMAVHADVQSSIRYRAERTVVAGFVGGTEPKTAKLLAPTINTSRFRLVYPDLATLTITQTDGTQREELVDAPYLAAALVGSNVSPNLDVATPWTGRMLRGFNQLSRQLDAVAQNQVATSGVTVLEDRPPAIRVRQGFTTNMSDILTRTPTVIQIADEVQQQTRSSLERFIGQKFLKGILGQIEGQLSMILKNLVAAQIISAYTGVRATTATDDPTVAEVSAFYAPVFPLLYIVVRFNVQSSLNA